jgi:enamine deaminase RidA (YjgF/YER057c/UK114 family)
MSKIEIAPVLPEGWSRGRGYAHALTYSGGRTIRVAGQLAVDDGAGQVPEGLPIGAQLAKALENVVTCVRAAGGSPEHIVNLRVFMTDMAAFRAAGAEIGAAWRANLGKHFPALTVVEITALYDPNAMIEIEAEAVVP